MKYSFQLVQRISVSPVSGYSTETKGNKKNTPIQQFCKKQNKKQQEKKENRQIELRVMGLRLLHQKNQNEQNARAWTSFSQYLYVRELLQYWSLR